MFIMYFLNYRLNRAIHTYSIRIIIITNLITIYKTHYIGLISIKCYLFELFPKILTIHVFLFEILIYMEKLCCCVRVFLDFLHGFRTMHIFNRSTRSIHHPRRFTRFDNCWNAPIISSGEYSVVQHSLTVVNRLTTRPSNAAG